MSSLSGFEPDFGASAGSFERENAQNLMLRSVRIPPVFGLIPPVFAPSPLILHPLLRGNSANFSLHRPVENRRILFHFLFHHPNHQTKTAAFSLALACFSP
jgi:hypothetical protein